MRAQVLAFIGLPFIDHLNKPTMTSLITYKGMRMTAISSLLALTVSLSAHAAIYPFDFSSDIGVVPQGGTTLSFEHAISIAETEITSFQFILTFNDNSSLLGTSGGIQG